MKNVTGMSVEKMMGRMFRQVDSVVWDLMSGKLGVRTSDGEIATIEGTGEDITVVINPFEDFGLAVPAFAQATPVDAVKEGDLIYTSGEAPGWIISIKTSAEGKKSFKLMRPGGNISTWVPPKVQMFGFDSGVLVVRSLINLLPTGADGLGSLQGMMLPMMMMGGDMDLEKMMPLMLMSQMNGGSTTANPMAGMMQMMMMSKMLGSNNPFSSNTNKSPFRT
jgi:hypothetical protein